MLGLFVVFYRGNSNYHSFGVLGAFTVVYSNADGREAMIWEEILEGAGSALLLIRVNLRDAAIIAQGNLLVFMPVTCVGTPSNSRL